MAKRDERAMTEVFDDDALFAPGSWDVGPPSARRGSLRPGARMSISPAARVSLAPAPSADAAAPRASGADERRAASVPPAPPATALEALASEPPAADLAAADEPAADSVSGARLVRPSRRALGAGSSSFGPMVPVSRPSPRRRRSWIAALPIVSLVLSSAGVGFLVFGSGAPADSGAGPAAAVAEPATAAAALPVPEIAAAPPTAVVAAPPDRAQPPAAAAAASDEVPPSLPAAAAGVPAAGTPAVAAVTTVELSVYPADAAVGYLGVMQRGGPPYRFEVPPGQRIAVEVARPGYGTRKVILDGSSARVSIGLRRSQPAP